MVSASDELEATPAECETILLDLTWAPAGLANLLGDTEPAVAPGEFGDTPDVSASECGLLTSATPTPTATAQPPTFTALLPPCTPFIYSTADAP
ncbi:hypothetical protein M2432_003195 [Mycobacterium sp. OTB74]|nr:hypothetical protein [Mycobacterium sp. OTB74]